jgi:hypothetical protein
MRYLVKNADDIPTFLPSWIPNLPTDEDLAKHIANLRIPAVSGGRPSLLLHDLGEENSNLDRDRTARIPDIFSFAYHTYVIRNLVNFFNLFIVESSSTRLDLERQNSCLMVCVIFGDFMSLQSQIWLA